MKDDEQNIGILEHPKFGTQMIENYYSLSEGAEAIIRQHHERYDGSGYPDRLVNENIATFVNIVNICNY